MTYQIPISSIIIPEKTGIFEIRHILSTRNQTLLYIKLSFYIKQNVKNNCRNKLNESREYNTYKFQKFKCINL